MISQSEYVFRRNALVQQLPPNSVAVVAAAPEKIRNGDAHFRYRQNSNFYYLTGFNEPDAFLVIKKTEKPAFYLFNRSRNLLQEQWTGARLGQEGACQQMGLQAAFSVDSTTKKLPQLIADSRRVFYPINDRCEGNTLISSVIAILNQQAIASGKPDGLEDLSYALSELRLIKSKAEIALMQHAASVSVEAHKRAMRACKNAEFEHQLQAELLYGFSYGGCNEVAYTPIVGGGKNACVLHYSDNNQKLNSGDLVLIDAGGEFQNYAADITRTFPVNGVFTRDQRLIYGLVLKAQKAAIASIQPGSSWALAQQIIVEILTAGLVELGLLKGSVSQLISSGAYKTFYMHNSGHWLGLDVHDSGCYKVDNDWRPLKPGMVLTVEPGLYISASNEVDSRWWNIGVRIEDDVVVTESGHCVLSAALPVEADDIEALMRD